MFRYLSYKQHALNLFKSPKISPAPSVQKRKTRQQRTGIPYTKITFRSTSEGNVSVRFSSSFLHYVHPILAASEVGETTAREGKTRFNDN